MLQSWKFSGAEENSEAQNAGSMQSLVQISVSRHACSAQLPQQSSMRSGTPGWRVFLSLPAASGKLIVFSLKSNINVQRLIVLMNKGALLWAAKRSQGQSAQEPTASKLALPSPCYRQLAWLARSLLSASIKSNVLQFKSDIIVYMLCWQT